MLQIAETILMMPRAIASLSVHAQPILMPGSVKEDVEHVIRVIIPLQ